MNMKLIRLTVWSRVVLLSLTLLSVLFIWPNWLSKALWERHRWLLGITRVALFAALVALVANDSGVVAASTLLSWPVFVGLTLAVRLAQPNAVRSP